MVKVVVFVISKKLMESVQSSVTIFYLRNHCHLCQLLCCHSTRHKCDIYKKNSIAKDLPSTNWSVRAMTVDSFQGQKLILC